ncbi:MAG: ribonuclease P protein component [Paracoccaceae bacterium]
MIPPQAPDIGVTAETSGNLPAVSHFVQLETLRHRPDFLKAASARRQGTNSFLLQARARDDGESISRIGFTASKKIGNAVARNRAKRRMRAAVHEILAREARPGWDYVLVARPQATIARPFPDLLADLQSAILSVHRTAK